MLAHSDRLVLPRITAPAARSRAISGASRGGVTPVSASDPAVVIMWSPVAMLSFTSTGMPCIAVGLEHRVQLWVELGDACEIVGTDGPGAAGAAAHRVLQLCDGGFLEFEVRNSDG